MSPSSDESSEDETLTPLPLVKDVIAVCYIDSANGDVDDVSDIIDETKVKWWSGTVLRVLPIICSSRFRGLFNVSFWPGNGEDAQDCSFFVLQS